MSNLQETEFRDQKTCVKPPGDRILRSENMCQTSRRQNLEIRKHVSNLQETEFRDQKTYVKPPGDRI